jgi:hypothetical protein
MELWEALMRIYIVVAAVVVPLLLWMARRRDPNEDN